MKHSIRRFTSMLLAIIMCLSLAATAFAAESVEAQASEAVVSNEVSVAAVEAVEEKEIYFLDLQTINGSKEFFVNPDQGARLWIVIGCNNSNCIVYLYINNIPVSNGHGHTIQAGAGAQKICLATNCSANSTYKIKIVGQNSQIAASVLQTN